MGDSAVLQEIRLTAPEVTHVGTSHRKIEKNYKNYVIPLGIEPITYHFRKRNFQLLHHLLLA